MLIVKRYTGTWCQPCKVLSPIMSEVEREVNGVQFQTIDVDQNRESAAQDGVSSIPSVLFIKNGQEVDRFIGVRSKSIILDLIKQHS